MVMLIAVDDAEGADVMPGRPNEHSSLGVPVGGCSHHLKCDRQNTSPNGRRRLQTRAAREHTPHTQAVRQGLYKRWKKRQSAVPKLKLTPSSAA